MNGISYVFDRRVNNTCSLYYQEAIGEQIMKQLQMT